VKRTVVYVCSECGREWRIVETFVLDYESGEPDPPGSYEPDPRDTWCKFCDAALEPEVGEPVE